MSSEPSPEEPLPSSSSSPSPVSLVWLAASFGGFAELSDPSVEGGGVEGDVLVCSEDEVAVVADVRFPSGSGLCCETHIIGCLTLGRRR